MVDHASIRGLTGRPILVTGGAGFIGANLVDRLARLGHDVIIYDSLVRDGVSRNLDWLRRRHGGRIRFLKADIRDGQQIAQAVEASDAVFHLAAQVAVTTSVLDVDLDFGVNLQGTLNVLSAIRRCERDIPLLFASTNKVYGALDDIPLTLTTNGYVPSADHIRCRGIDESRRLDFHTPYGCSKGGADQYVLDHARVYGLATTCLRMSCVYGPRQLGTEDQGWIAHFIRAAVDGRQITLFGDGYQVRDVLYIDDAIDAYLAAWTAMDVAQGQAFNLGGGVSNAVTLWQVLGLIRDQLGSRLSIVQEDWRPGDQRYYVSDTTKARHMLGLAAPLGWQDGLKRLTDWFMAEHDQMPPAAAEDTPNRVPEPLLSRQ
jgi:CDP-paratose 2-epimerase